MELRVYDAVVVIHSPGPTATDRIFVEPADVRATTEPRELRVVTEPAESRIVVEV